MEQHPVAEKKKFKAKLRDKFKRRAAKNEGGRRSLSYGDRTAEDYYGEYKEVSLPESQRSAFNASLKGAMKKRAEEVLSRGKDTVRGKLQDSAKEIHKGLTGIRHPAQLIPAAKGARSLHSIIKALIKK